MPRLSATDVFARELLQTANRVDPQSAGFDFVEYQGRPIEFCKDVLGFWPWSRQQELIIAATTHERCSVRSGHKLGKSASVAAIGLYDYCCFPGSRVRAMAAVATQIDDIVWLEVKRLVRNAHVKVPGVLHEKAYSGLYDPQTLGEFKGRAADSKEAVAGFSGKRLRYIVDEASGVPDALFQAMAGNRAGGNASIVMISNPTKVEGEFYASHHSKRIEAIGPTGYYCVAIDSRESPNVTGEWREIPQWDDELEEWVPRTEMIGGLATPAWIEQMAAEHGEDSAEFAIRVKGSFAAAEEGRAFPRSLLEAAVARYESTPFVGRLYIGLDPAGEGGQGDYSALCVRRGNKATPQPRRRGLDADAHLDWCQAVMAEFRESDDHAPGNEPIIVVDASGDVGAKVYRALKTEAMATRRFWVVPSRGGDTDAKKMRQPSVYRNHRDELAASARLWLREGGAIPRHPMLLDDIGAGRFESDVRERLTYTPKEDLRKTLGRSPDDGDAFFLCCWVPAFARRAAEQHQRAAIEAAGLPAVSQYDAAPARGAGLDPYAALDVWRDR